MKKCQNSEDECYKYKIIIQIIGRTSVDAHFELSMGAKVMRGRGVHGHWGSCHLVDRAAAADGQRGWDSVKIRNSVCYGILYIQNYGI